LKNMIQAFVNNAATDPKAGATVVAWTVGSAAAETLEWVSSNSANIGILIGAILSMVLIYTNVKQHRVKMKIMEHDLEERKSRKGRRDRKDDLDIVDN